MNTNPMVTFHQWLTEAAQLSFAKAKTATEPEQISYRVGYAVAKAHDASMLATTDAQVAECRDLGHQILDWWVAQA